MTVIVEICEANDYDFRTYNNTTLENWINSSLNIYEDISEDNGVEYDKKAVEKLREEL